MQGKLNITLPKHNTELLSKNLVYKIKMYNALSKNIKIQ